MIELISLPLKDYSITSDYGMRSGSFHNGIDLIGGDELYSVNDGDVVVVGYESNGYGNYVIINYNSFCALYAHLNQVDVIEGQVVQSGQIIGVKGNTGHSYGKHLHFELAKGEYNSKTFFERDSSSNYIYNRVDPAPFLDSAMLTAGITNADIRRLSSLGVIDYPDYHQKHVNNNTLPTYDVILKMLTNMIPHR